MSIREHGKVKCLECGKYFSFLAPHLNRVHQMNCREYRERWSIPLQQPLASAEHSRRCRENIVRRINSGDIDPAVQVALMADAYRKTKGNGRGSNLQKLSASRNVTKHRIWDKSPVVKKVPEAIRRGAVRRMKARKQNGETVQDISKETGISVSCLYRWQSEDN